MAATTVPQCRGTPVLIHFLCKEVTSAGGVGSHLYLWLAVQPVHAPCHAPAQCARNVDEASAKFPLSDWFCVVFLLRAEPPRCGIERPEDIKDLFIPHFYFGCEADDPMNASAFNTKVNPFGAKLQAVFSSDIGHWDVPDVTEVTEEAYELVEHEVMTEDNFRDFVFVHPAKLWTDMNPNFFKGTVVETAVKKLLA